jgi:hypothetical protein
MIVASVLHQRVIESTREIIAMTWNVSGTYFEACNCEAACPCVFLSPPTEGECTAIVGWHIDDGSYDGVSVAGLNVALAVYSGGHMATTPWRVAVYLDDQASAEQADALGAIFSGAAGGHPAVLAGHIGEVMGMTAATIAFDAGESTLTCRVGDVADVKMTAIEGQGGSHINISGHPLAVAPGNDVVAARSDAFRYDDHGYEWELSERNGFFSPFQYAG